MNRIGARCIASALAATVLVLPVFATVPASAQTTVCSGVTTAEVRKCDPVTGYADAMAVSHWGMYKGHNCTNYGAYRLIMNGVARPSYNLGNANTWAERAKEHGIRVDTTPAVGAIGVWPGKNHLVFVDVVGNGYLSTSEDNYPGYYPKGMFRKLKVYPGDSSYPAQFIHFRDQMTSAVPKITGTAKVGWRQTAAAGTWNPNGVTLAYRWLRDGSYISQAIASTYVLSAADAGHTISIRVTGSKTGLSNKVETSAPTAAIAPGSLKNTVAPTVTGIAKVASTLTAGEGAWSQAGTAYAYQWLAGGAAVAGATARTFVPTAAQLDKTMAVRVTATKAGYLPLAKTSATSATVAPGTLANTKAPSVSGTALVGSTLTAAAGTWAPAGVAFTYQWLRSGEVIGAATGSSYTLTTADIGKTVGAKVTATKAGYTTMSVPSNETAAVKSPSRVFVSATLGKGRVSFAITVKASGVTPTGKVTIKDGSTVLKTLILTGGKASVTLTGQKSGIHTYRINYLGDANAFHQAVTKRVKIS